MSSLLRGDASTCALVTVKSLAAAIVVFGALAALISTKAPRPAIRHAEKQKPVGDHKAAMSDKPTTKHKAVAADRSNTENKVAAADGAVTDHKTVIKPGIALISRVNAAIREAPRLNAKILDRAVFGSSVDVIGQEHDWAQVRAPAQNVSGWIEKSALNF